MPKEKCWLSANDCKQDVCSWVMKAEQVGHPGAVGVLSISLLQAGSIPKGIKALMALI